MNYNEQIDLLTNDLHNIIYRYKSEYDLHDETIIGVLEGCKCSVIDSFVIEFESEDDDEDCETQEV
jgi:hypothetical protein